jgi:hypothetical protein
MKTTDPVDKAEYASNKQNMLSGNTYVTAMLREDVDKYPPRDYLVRIPVGTFVMGVGNCDHGHTICAQWDCVESWSLDYKIMLWRTNAGRLIADKLRIPRTFKFERKGIERIRHEDALMEDPA